MASEPIKKLYRSRSSRMLAGVCGGIAEYFAIDPSLVRLAFVFMSLLGLSGIIFYIIAILIVPTEPEKK